MAFQFPAGDMDDADRLLRVLGTFWASTYQGSFPIRSILDGRARLDHQAHLNLLELVAAMSRFEVPIFHTENWYFLTLRASQKNQTAANIPAFDGTYNFDGTVDFGVPVTSTFAAWSLPANLADVKLVMNRVTAASVTLTKGLDFVISEGAIIFRDDPFANPLIATQAVIVDDVIVDQECGLWLYRGQFDWDTIYKQFGYVLGLHLKSSEGYRALINAIFDAFIDGGTAGAVERLLAAAAGVPLAKSSGETVQEILLDQRHLWIITDQHAYSFVRSATPVVAIGDALQKGQTLTDTLQLYEFGSGQVPTAAQVPALALGAGLLGTGYFQDLVFENKIVPLVVEEDVEGFTKVSFEVGGVPTDVEKFWDDIHAAGIAANQTLAMLLDQRPKPVNGQPTAKALPTTINPLGFLLTNVFRDNLYVARFKVETFGENALGMGVLTMLRQVVPAHTALIVLVELAVSDNPIILDGRYGDDTQPGCAEIFTPFSGTLFAESLDPTIMITESVKSRQLSGRCV